LQGTVGSVTLCVVTINILSSRYRAAAWAAQVLDEAGPGFEIGRALQDIGRTVGARHVALVMQHVPGIITENALVADTFGDEWRQHAMALRLASVDPCRTAATAVAPVIDWSDLPRDKVRIRKFFREFQERQLGRKALTMLHRGHLGDRSLLTFTSDATDRRWEQLVDELREAGGVIHPAFHRFVLRTHFGIDGAVAIRLTPREKECLNWAAHGHTSKKIGDELGLTAATVNFFIDAAVQKLAASNRAHAAAKAVALGLISPPR
jgi:LuxR family transcriptional regulator, quorum-sensing system regulator SdiA